MPVLIHHALSRIDTLTMPYIDSGRHARLGKALKDTVAHPRLGAATPYKQRSINQGRIDQDRHHEIVQPCSAVSGCRNSR